MALEWRTRSGAALIRVASAGRHRVARPRGPEARRAASSVCRGRVLRRLPPAPLAHCPGLANDPYASTSAYSQTSSGTRRSSLREGPRQGCFPRAARAGSVGRGALRAAPARCSVAAGRAPAPAPRPRRETRCVAGAYPRPRRPHATARARSASSPGSLVGWTPGSRITRAQWLQEDRPGGGQTRAIRGRATNLRSPSAGIQRRTRQMAGRPGGGRSDRARAPVRTQCTGRDGRRAHRCDSARWRAARGGVPAARRSRGVRGSPARAGR